MTEFPLSSNLCKRMYTKCLEKINASLLVYARPYRGGLTWLYNGVEHHRGGQNKHHYQFEQLTESGDVCHFPFYHGGKSHMNCIEFGSDRPWCATANLQVDPTAWDYCKPGITCFM